MLRLLFTIILAFLTNVTFPQLPIVIERVTQNMIEKIIPRAFDRNVAIYLTQSEVEKLALAMPNISNNILNNQGVYYYKGILYGGSKYFYADDNSESAKIMAEAVKAFSNMNYSSLATNVKIDYSDLIKMIQFDLNSSGYLLKIDGKLGKNTKFAIKDFYDVNCDSFSIGQVVNIVYNLVTHNKRWPDNSISDHKIQSIRKYDLKIVNSNGEINELKGISAEDVNKTFGEFNCSADEICLSIEKISKSSMSFSCKDKLGNSISAYLSSEKCTVDIGFKHDKYKSSKLSISTDGKIKINSTRTL